MPLESWLKLTTKNLKIILLSATPMKNLPDDIIPLINFLRPQDQPIQRNIDFEGTDFDMKQTEISILQKNLFSLSILFQWPILLQNYKLVSPCKKQPTKLPCLRGFVIKSGQTNF